MAETMTLREILTPFCPLGTDKDLMLEWVQDGSLFRVKEVLGYYLDIAPQLANYRLVTTPIENESGWERGWCYVGKGRASFMAAVLAATLWDGSDDSEPLGWNKSLQTGEFREAGSSQSWQAGRAVPTMVDVANSENAWPTKV